MNPAFLFVMLVAVSTPKNDVDAHQRFMRLHHVWQDRHESAALDQKSVSEVLVFDPRKSAMWVESDGTKDEANVQSLPGGLEWSAYVITPCGVSSIPFPVRINHPRRDSENEDDTEQIWIIGANKDSQWQFSIAGTKKSHMFHIRSGSPSFAYQFNLPDRDASPADDEITTSILDPETTSDRKWSDNIRTKWFSIDILRTKAP